MPATDAQVQEYKERGYFVADDAAAPDMVDRLEAATRRALAANRKTPETEDGRALGETINPALGEPAFSEYMESPALLDYVHRAIGEQLRLGWVSVFAQSPPYDCGWHRDTGGQDRDIGGEAELEFLSRYRKNLFRWHLALVDDPCLWLVPSSHNRTRTEVEKDVLTNRRFDDLEGQVNVTLRRGQTVFWNGSLFHRARTPEGMTERMTLHSGLIKHEDGDVPEEWESQFAWRLVDGVREGLSGQVQVWFDRWRALQGGNPV